jgi:hypothetical protein
MSDDTITGYLLLTGWKPGEQVTAPVLRSFATFIEHAALQEIQDIASRYPCGRLGLQETMGDALIRQGRNVAHSCAAAVKEALQ